MNAPLVEIAARTTEARHAIHAKTHLMTVKWWSTTNKQW
jgi:hypothetical protein